MTKVRRLTQNFLLLSTITSQPLLASLATLTLKVEKLASKPIQLVPADKLVAKPAETQGERPYQVPLSAHSTEVSLTLHLLS